MSEKSEFEEQEETTIEEEMSPEDARIASGRNEVRVLDVRDKEEVAEGTVPGAMWAPEDRLEEMAEYVLRGDEMPILLVCSDGSKSEELAERLREADFEAAYLKGGFNSWSSKGLPQDPRDETEYEGPDMTMPGSGGDMGGDESAEEAKIARAQEYYDEEEERTGHRPPEARAETVVDQRDLEMSRQFERKERGQDADDMLASSSSDEEDGEGEGSPDSDEGGSSGSDEEE